MRKEVCFLLAMLSANCFLAAANDSIQNPAGGNAVIPLAASGESATTNHPEFEYTVSKTLIPPTPSSSVYQEYRGSQPSLATGTVNIPISLYEINCFGMKLPFGLVYNSNGIKVNQDPYPCGYGWILTPGLRVSRTIMGRPDEQYEWRTYSENNVTIDVDSLKTLMLVDDHAIVQDGLYDSQQDIFSVSLPNESFNFLLRREGNGWKAITVDTNCRIEVLEGATHFNGFRITDGSGIVYQFKDYYEGSYSQPARYVTSWMLDRIILANGKEIVCYWISSEHQMDVYREYAPYSLRDNQSYSYVDNISGERIISYPDSIISTQTGDFSLYPRTSPVQHLSQVDFPGGKIVISYDSSDDYVNPLIQNFKVVADNGGIVKTANFEFGDTRASRFLLKRLDISDEGIYTFDYYRETDFNYVENYAKDFWGYYNGKSQNKSAVPYINFKMLTSQYSSDSGYFKYFGDADRSIDEDAMQANMLKKVTYPTGGWSVYEYETHHFEGHPVATNMIANNAPLTAGGGLRVKKVTSASGSDTEPVVYEYAYGVNGNGFAVSLAEPTLDTFVQIYRSYDRVEEIYKDETGFVTRRNTVYPTYRQVMFKTSSDYLSYAINATPIWYEEVTEYVDESKTVYEFTNPDNNTNNFLKDESGMAYITLGSVFSKGPQLRVQKIYELMPSGYVLKKSVENTYGYVGPADDEQTPRGLFVMRKIYCQLGGCEDAPDFDFAPAGGVFCTLDRTGVAEFPYDKDEVYHYNATEIHLKSHRLIATKETVYASEGDKVVNTALSYSAERSVVKEQTVDTSNGGVVKVTNYYPFESEYADSSEQETMLNLMTAENMVSTPFKTIRTEDGMSVKTTSIYDNYGGKLYLPESQITYNNNVEGNRIDYDYDNLGNIRSATFNGDAKETYLWGYGGLYPVLYVQGLDFSEYGSLAGSGNTDLSAIPSYQLESRCASIRSALEGEALVSSYTYRPLVGMTSVTDPQGRKYTYNYNQQNRLSEIVDYDGVVRDRFAYRMASDRMTASVGYDSGATAGSRFSAWATIDGGSGIYEYEWQVFDGDGNAVEIEDATGKTIHLTVSDAGDYTAKVKTTDSMTGEIVETSSTLTVKPQRISLRLVQKTDGSAIGEIDCPAPMTVKLYATSQLHKADGSNGTGTIKITGDAGGTEQYGFTEVSWKTIDYSVQQAGTIRIEMEIAEDSEGTLTLDLLSVTGSHGEICDRGNITLEKP